MKLEQELEREKPQAGQSPTAAVMLAVPDAEFEREVLERLGRLEAKLDMITGDGQPGRMKLAEDRIASLEKDSVRRSAYDRVINAVIAFTVSAAIALHDHLGLK